MKRAVYWTAWGKQYLDEARVSAESVKRHMPDLPRVLYTREKEKKRAVAGPVFDAVLSPTFGRLPSHCPEGLESLYYRVDAMHQLAGKYARLLFLDSDTYMCAPVPEVFEALNRFDFVAVISAGRITRKTVNSIPESFAEYNGGVMAFRNSPEIRAFFDGCRDMYEEHRHHYSRGNQGAIREAVWLDKTGLQFGTLPSEYCCRFPFGFWALGQVKILHGRANQISYEEMTEIINEVYPRMRAWGPGCFSTPHPGFKKVKLRRGGRGRLR